MGFFQISIRKRFILFHLKKHLSSFNGRWPSSSTSKIKVACSPMAGRATSTEVFERAQVHALEIRVRSWSFLMQNAWVFTHGSLLCFRSLCTRSVLPLLVCRPKCRSSKQYDLHGSHTTSYNLGSFSRIRFTSQHEVFVLACGGIWGGEPLEVTQKTKHDGEFGGTSSDMGKFQGLRRHRKLRTAQAPSSP